MHLSQRLNVRAVTSVYVLVLRCWCVFILDSPYSSHLHELQIYKTGTPYYLQSYAVKPDEYLWQRGNSSGRSQIFTIANLQDGERQNEIC